MKKIYLILSALFIISCEEAYVEERIESTECKTIKAKDQPIENRFSAGDYVFGSGSITKSQTVYYFYYTDGSTDEVDRSTYFKHDVGEKRCVTRVEYRRVRNPKTK